MSLAPSWPQRLVGVWVLQATIPGCAAPGICVQRSPHADGSSEFFLSGCHHTGSARKCREGTAPRDWAVIVELCRLFFGGVYSSGMLCVNNKGLQLQGAVLDIRSSAEV